MFVSVFESSTILGSSHDCRDLKKDTGSDGLNSMCKLPSVSGSTRLADLRKKLQEKERFFEYLQPFIAVEIQSEILGRTWRLFSFPIAIKRQGQKFSFCSFVFIPAKIHR